MFLSTQGSGENKPSKVDSHEPLRRRRWRECSRSKCSTHHSWQNLCVGSSHLHPFAFRQFTDGDALQTGLDATCLMAFRIFAADARRGQRAASADHGTAALGLSLVEG